MVVHAPDEATAREIDDLLWHYPPDRFLPHSLEEASVAAPLESPPRVQAPLLVTWQQPSHYDGVLVNLSPAVPDFFGRFDRVAEIIVQDTREQGRARYKFYRDRGFPLYHHDLDDWETDPTTP